MFNKIRVKGLILITIFCILNLVGCSKEKVVKREEYILDTLITLKVYGSDSEKVAQKCIDEIKDIDNKMSPTKENSEIVNINKNSGKQFVKVSDDTFKVIESAYNYSKLTDRFFDPTIAPIVNLWGIGTEHQKVPSQNEINNKLKLVNYKDIKIDNKNKAIKLEKENQGMDLGGIAKGYSADKVKQVLIRNGIKKAFINLGGNIYALGTNPEGNEWRIGIQNPFKNSQDQQNYIGIVKVKDKSVVTSGDYERFFERNGKRYHHIFNTRTGYPSQNEIKSVTIISDKSIDGDALSTSAFVLGLDKGKKLIESIKNVDAIFVTKDKKVYVTYGIKDKFELKNEEFSYETRR